MRHFLQRPRAPTRTPTRNGNARKESLQAQRQTAATEHQRAESERVQMLSQERARYQSECDQREAEVAEHNLAVDTLIANLGYGTVEAVQEYVSIVLANSVYPQVSSWSSTRVNSNRRLRS